MKRIAVLASLFILVAGIQPGYAGACSPDEIKQAVGNAAELLRSKGKAALPELEKFRFCGGDGYVFINDDKGKLLFHPTIKALIGKNNIADQDAKGKYFAAEMLAKAKKPGEGWVSYTYLNPATKKLEDKCTFVKASKLDGQWVYVAGGIYGVSPQNCK